MSKHRLERDELNAHIAQREGSDPPAERRPYVVYKDGRRQYGGTIGEGEIIPLATGEYIEFPTPAPDPWADVPPPPHPLRPPGMNLAELTRRIRFYPPAPHQSDLASQVRREAARYGEAIVGIVPGGREQSLAITALEESLMWAVAGINREGK